MLDENGALIQPLDFLPTAERLGLIQAIDRWVIHGAISRISGHSMVGRDLCLEVNLSGKVFKDSELLTMVEHELVVSGIKPASLIFEITETAVIADITQAQVFISKLKSLGCQFALDDFGVGFSSFSYLKHLPIDYLKIDGSFIRNLPSSETDQHLVKAIITMAHGLGKQTIAEFVGDKQTVDLLINYGVDYIQGYYVGRPAPAPETIANAALESLSEDKLPLLMVRNDGKGSQEKSLLAASDV